MKRLKKKTIIILSSIFGTLLIATICLACFDKQIYAACYKNYNAPIPVIDSKWHNTNTDENTIGDFYVSVVGDDLNDGSKEHPFKTIDKAKEAVANAKINRSSDITVIIESGEYRVDRLFFGEEDNGAEQCHIIYKGNGDVRLNAGVSLSPSNFKRVNEYPEISSRLNDDAKRHARVLDLSEQGISKEQIGKIYPYGAYLTTSQYQGEEDGPIYAELFINEKRMQLAKYPNEGFIQTDEVVFSSRDKGVKLSNGDPKGDVYKVSDELASRIKGWKTLDDVWMYGYFMYDWADQSTKIYSFDANTNELTTKFYSFFGARENAPYLFFNCLEELDSPGEYYIDRTNNLLIVYETDSFDTSSLELSISTEPVIQFCANYVTLDNLKITGSRRAGIYGNANSHHCNIKNCKVYNIGGYGISMIAHDNSITHCEVAELGSYGIGVMGGDKNTLEKANIEVTNNLIHDYQNIDRATGAGITTYGAGIHISNNEIYNANHTGIHYSGIYHVIENNIIHDVCQQSDDAGAIYAGRSYTSYGNIIRNNLIYYSGNNKHASKGIYLDDAMSGQVVYGNLLINIPDYGIVLGGGRDLKVYDNIVVNAKKAPLLYDARAREGLEKETFFSSHVKEGGDMWIDLEGTPWKEEAWQNEFPEYKDLTADVSNLNNPNCFVNPANTKVNNNIIFDKKASLGDINDYVYIFSDVSSNEINRFNSLKKYFVDYKNGNYSLKDLSSFNGHQYINIKDLGRY